jgi:serine phosphatase RsbU (regulator of sigma subunit)
MTLPVSIRVGRLYVESRHLPATQGGGGDIHDVIATPFGVRLFVGDVMGSGLPANQTGLSVLNAWRALARTEPSLAGIAVRLHALIARSEHPERFVTALLANFPVTGEEPGTGYAAHAGGSWAELVCCGHPPPLLLRGDSAAFVELYAAPPLGLLDLADGWCRASMIPVGDGDQLLLYTDGVSEARDAAGRFFPLAQVTAEAVGQDPDVGSHLLDALVTSLDDHVGNRGSDDILLLLVTMRLAANLSIVIAGQAAAADDGMKLCRWGTRSSTRGGGTWRPHHCPSASHGRRSSGTTRKSPAGTCATCSPATRDGASG